jgi:hypothetical protein
LRSGTSARSGECGPTASGKFLLSVVDGFSIRDTVFTNTGGTLSSSSLLEARNGVLSKILLAGTGAPTSLRWLTVAHSPGTDAGFDVALRSIATTGSGLVLDGILVDGWQGPVADHAWNASNAVMTTATFGGGPCFHENVSDGPSSVLDNLPPTAVRGVAPGLVDPGRDASTPPPDRRPRMRAAAS